MAGAAHPTDRLDRTTGSSSRVVHGWAASAPGQGLERLRYPAPALGSDDVRVAVTHCGVCYTDIHAIDDFFGITTFPFVPGHEIAGRVEACGDGVTALREGDRVGIGWQGRSCGRCSWCARGEVQLCYDIGSCSTCEGHGGFADSVTVDGRFAYRLPERMSSEAAAVLMCAGVAVFTPLRRYRDGSDSRVPIYGMGGLGHLAIQFAHALGYQVTVLSTSASKEQEARSLGADDFVLLGDRDRMRPFDYAFGLVLCTAHGDIDWEELTNATDKRGRIVLVGFPEVSVQPTNLVAHELTITGSLLGNHADVREMLTVADVHGIAPRLERLPMGRVNDAIGRLKAGDVRYRMVLTAE